MQFETTILVLIGNISWEYTKALVRPGVGMGKWSVILGVAVLSFSATFVRADMAGPPDPDARMPDCSIAVQAKTDKQLPDQAAASEPVSLGSLDMALPGDLSDDSADSKQQRSDVRVLSGGPSSVTLFFSALGGLGVWHLGRSTRKFRLAFAPGWYHSGGPIQVGHVTAISPDLTAPATISICDLLADQSIRLLLRRAVPLCFRSQCIPALATPRAPPLCCL